MADLVIPDCFLEDQAATVRAMLLPDEKCVNAPQMLLDVIGWACKLMGGEGKAMELLAWLSLEFNLACREDESWLRQRIESWLNGEWEPRPEWLVGEDQPNWVFPPELSRYEKWLALHRLHEIAVPSFDQYGCNIRLTEEGVNGRDLIEQVQQGLLDAWAWRIHTAGEEGDKLVLLDQICSEFPRSYYLIGMIRDRMDWRCPVGDWQAIRKDALAWRKYYGDVFYPMLEALRDTLKEYGRTVEEWRGNAEVCAQYEQYRKDIERLEGEWWPDIRDFCCNPVKLDQTPVF